MYVLESVFTNLYSDLNSPYKIKSEQGSNIPCPRENVFFPSSVVYISLQYCLSMKLHSFLLCISFFAINFDLA